MSFGEFLWVLLTFYCLFFYFLVLFRVLDDLFRDPARSGMSKTAWILFLLVVPIIAMIVYMISNGAGMTARTLARTRAQEQRQREYILDVVASSDRQAARTAGAPDLPAQAQDPSPRPTSTR